MTEKQRLFAEYFAECRDGEKSAVMAGYSSNRRQYAKKLLANPDVVRLIDTLSDKTRNKNILDSGQCRAVLSEIVSNEKNSPNERMKAIDLLMDFDESQPDDSNISISVNYCEPHENQI